MEESTSEVVRRLQGRWRRRLTSTTTTTTLGASITTTTTTTTTASTTTATTATTTTATTTTATTATTATTTTTTWGHICGNGVTTGNESCDDGNLALGDGCSEFCQKEIGYACEVVAASAYGRIVECNEKCGNYDRTPSEECDDGNTESGDGCDSRCQLESDFICKRDIVMVGNTATTADVCQLDCSIEPSELAKSGYQECIADNTSRQPPPELPVYCVPRKCEGTIPPEAPKQVYGCHEALNVRDYHNANIMCRQYSGPQVVEARWDPSGFSFTIKMSARVQIGLESQYGDCKMFLENATALLGEGSRCELAEDGQQVVVTLGIEPELTIGTHLSVLAGSYILANSSGWPGRWSLLSVSSSILALQVSPKGFAAPVARLQSLRTIGAGADLTLDAKSSSGGGALGLQYTWYMDPLQLQPEWTDVVDSDSASDLDAITTLLQDTLDEFIGNSDATLDASVLTLASEKLKPLPSNGSVKLDPPLLPVLLTFRVRVSSRLDGQASTDSCQVAWYPFTSIPPADTDFPPRQQKDRSESVELQVDIKVPMGADPCSLPRYHFTWTMRQVSPPFHNLSELPADGSYVDASHYVTSNPGRLVVPGLTMAVGTVEFVARCEYVTGEVVDSFPVDFQVEYTATKPIAVLTGASLASASCGATYSAIDSYDPSFVGSDREHVLPLPQDQYEFEWECIVAAIGTDFISRPDTDPLILSIMSAENGEACPVKASASHNEFTFPPRTLIPNSLIRLRVRVVPRDGSQKSEWEWKLLRFVPGNLPDVRFAVMPTSPVRVDVSHQVIVVIVKPPNCYDKTKKITFSTLLTTASDRQEAGSEKVVRTERVFEGLENMPKKLKQYAGLSASGSVQAQDHVIVLSLTISSNVMLAGGRYRLRITETGSETWTSESPLMVANAAPTVGKLTVDPTQGVAPTTIFELRNSKWLDPHLPLKYAIWGNVSASDKPFLLVDWNSKPKVQSFLQQGNWTIFSRAKDFYGAISENVATFDTAVQVYAAELSVEAAQEKISCMSETVSDAQVLSSFLPVALASLPNVIDAEATRTFLSSLNTAMSLSSGEGGSKEGGMKDANFLNQIISVGTLDVDTRKLATSVLSNSFAIISNAEDVDKPTGIPMEDATMLASSIASLVTLQETSFGLDRLGSTDDPINESDVDGASLALAKDVDPEQGSTLVEVANGVGMMMVQGLISEVADASSMNGTQLVAPTIVTESLTMGCAVIPVESVAAKMLANPSGNASAQKVAFAIPGIGSFDIPSAAFAQVTRERDDLGFEGVHPVGASVNRWAGNPLGTGKQTGNDVANCSDTLNFSGNVSEASMVRNCSAEIAPRLPLGHVVGLGLKGGGTRLSARIFDLDEGIEIRLPLKDMTWERIEEEMLLGVLPRCRFWDPDSLSWKDTGCKAIEVTNGGTTLLCVCTHLTDFGTFAEAAADKRTASNVDIITQFSTDGLRPDNPVLWLVLSIFCVNLIWIVIGVSRDRANFNKLTEDDMIRLHFKPRPQTRLDSNTRGGPRRWLFRLCRKRKTTSQPPEEQPSTMSAQDRSKFDFMQFRQLLHVLRNRCHYSAFDMNKPTVREQVIAVYKAELWAALEKRYEDVKQKKAAQGDSSPVSVPAIFRDSALVEALRVRVNARHEAILAPLTSRLPHLPWSCTGYLKINCHGVHPLERKRWVREHLTMIHRILPARLEITNFGLSVHLIRAEQAHDAKVGPPPKNSGTSPWLQASWGTVSHISCIAEDDFYSHFGTQEEEKQIAQLEDRIENLVAFRKGIPQNETHAFTLELINEWERGRVGILNDRASRDYQEYSFFDAEVERFQTPTTASSATIRNFAQPIGELQGTKDNLNVNDENLTEWEARLAKQIRRGGQEHRIADMFSSGVEDRNGFSVWGLEAVAGRYLDSEVLRMYEAGTFRNALRLRLCTQAPGQTNSDDDKSCVNNDWFFSWSGLQELRALLRAQDSSVTREDEQSYVASSGLPEVDIMLCGLEASTVVTLKDMLEQLCEDISVEISAAPEAERGMNSTLGPKSKAWKSDFALATRKALDKRYRCDNEPSNTRESREGGCVDDEGTMVESTTTDGHYFHDTYNSNPLSSDGANLDGKNVDIRTYWMAFVTVTREGEVPAVTDWVPMRIELISEGLSCRLRFSCDPNAPPQSLHATTSVRGPGFSLTNLQIQMLNYESFPSIANDLRACGVEVLVEIQFPASQHATSVLVGAPPHYLHGYEYTSASFARNLMDALRDGGACLASSNAKANGQHQPNDSQIDGQQGMSDLEKEINTYGDSKEDLERYMHFQFRRYEFFFWHPIKLVTRIFIREHPCFKMFVNSLVFLAVERVLIFSCSLLGSIVAAALFFDGGAVNVAKPDAPLPDRNETEANLAWWQTTSTMTTTNAPYNKGIDATTMIVIQIVVSLITVEIGLIPAMVCARMFAKPEYHSEVPEAEQRRIVRKWKVKRYIGFCISGFYILCCYFYLWQFAMNKPMEVTTGFTVSAIINLSWKLGLKPLVVVFMVAGVIGFLSSLQVANAVLHATPQHFFDFSMFTATDLDDMANQEAALACDADELVDAIDVM